MSLWLWSAGRQLGVTDDEERAKAHAEKAALGDGCRARLELVIPQIGADLVPVYVPTAITYDGIPRGNRVMWVCR